ncbi:MAG: hypothetical protein M9887_11110 [Chitinophagales bacterium]|nr:hypothetical protein [Chitinophagales bacterium]
MKIKSLFRLKGMVAAYPIDVVNTDELSFNTIIERETFKRKIGISQRHTSNGRLTAKDLGIVAFRKLLTGLDWGVSDIDLVVSVTQSSDFAVPGNSFLYQKELKLRESCHLVDLNSGCTGFVQGMITLLSQGEFLNIKKAILIVGDTDILSDETRTESNKLIGDAVCAIAFEKTDVCNEYVYKNYNLGLEYSTIIARSSGARYCVNNNKNSLSPVINMDGSRVFSFIAENVIPFLKEFESEKEDKTEYYFIHQPNLMFHQYIIKKMNWETERCPTIISEFGNVSSATIPLTIIRHTKYIKCERIISLISFGVGLSCSALQMSMSPLDFVDEIGCLC